MFSILHISDLHRSSEEPVDNDSLLAALLADREVRRRNTAPRRLDMAPRCPPSDHIPRQICGATALDTPSNHCL